MGKPYELGSDKKRAPQSPDLTRSDEARCIIAEYMAELREIIRKLQRRLD